MIFHTEWSIANDAIESFYLHTQTTYISVYTEPYKYIQKHLVFYAYDFR